MAEIDVEKDRLKLHTILSGYIKDTPQYQPPGTLYLQYPSLVYHVIDIETDYANNEIYSATIVYEVTYISRDVTDNTPFQMIAEIPYTTFSNAYVVDKLNHTLLNIRRKI